MAFQHRDIDPLTSFISYFQINYRPCQLYINMWLYTWPICSYAMPATECLGLRSLLKTTILMLGFKAARLTSGFKISTLLEGFTSKGPQRLSTFLPSVMIRCLFRQASQPQKSRHSSFNACVDIMQLSVHGRSI